MDERLTTKITSLLEEVFEDGIREGRDLERQETIQHLVQTLQERRPAPPARTRKSSTAPAPSPVNGQVSSALAELASDNSEGVFPDVLADKTKLKVRDVRQALRHLTMTGQARRMARGRYLPAKPFDSAEPGTFMAAQAAGN